MDSVLFEDDKELEYFDVLDLLPLSNVRLQFDDRNGSKNSSARKGDRNFESLGREFYHREPPPSNVVENCQVKNSEESQENTRENVVKEREIFNRESEGLEPDIAEAVNESKIREINDSKKFVRIESSESRKLSDSPGLNKEQIDKSSADRKASGFADEVFYPKSKKHVLILDSDEDKFRANVAVVRPAEEFRQIEESEDYKSIWISDSEETEEMSRRPQVLKVIDNEITKRNRNSVIETGDVAEAMKCSKEVDKGSVSSEGTNGDFIDSSDAPEVADNPENPQEKVCIEEVKTFFETKCKENREGKADHAAGKLERIIKETTSIFGKACSAVKGSLGFEARSESSDLGLGSESGSDTRRQSMDEVDETEESSENRGKRAPSNDGENNRSGLSRSFSCMDSVKNEDSGPEFDHIRYKIMKSDLFSKNMFGSMKKDQAFDGLMQYLQEYSFHDLLVDNNVVIIEPVRAETMERKSSSTYEGKTKNPSSCRIAGAIQKKTQQANEAERNSENQEKSPKQSSLRKYFFYHPIRVNRELIDDELPDPDTVRNVRKMFEGTLKLKTPDPSFSRNSPTRKTVSMKDLRQIEGSFEGSDKTDESRSSSRARNLTRLFENQDKVSEANKDGMESPRSDSKTRIIAQAFEARSGQTSPSDSGLSKHKGIKYLHNWDAGSVSSGVSSDYPDTDPGSGVQCTSSEEEDEGQDEDEIDNGPGHFVSQDVLKKIRECGTSVTYYGGKVVNTHNSPLISPPINGKRMRKIMKNEPRMHQEPSKDYVKFRLVKSNSCDSRLELAGRLVNESKGDKPGRKISEPAGVPRTEYASKSDLRKCPIIESLNVDMVTSDTMSDEIVEPEVKKEPPIVIGLEPKKEEIKEPEIFKVDFKLGRLEDTKCYANKFSNSALNQWEMNDTIEDRKCKFGEIDFEEFEVLEDSLNPSVKKN